MRYVVWMDNSPSRALLVGAADVMDALEIAGERFMCSPAILNCVEADDALAVRRRGVDHALHGPVISKDSPDDTSYVTGARDYRLHGFYESVGGVRTTVYRLASHTQRVGENYLVITRAPGRDFGRMETLTDDWKDALSTHLTHLHDQGERHDGQQ